jgi:hypothetical protein
VLCLCVGQEQIEVQLSPSPIVKLPSFHATLKISKTYIRNEVCFGAEALEKALFRLFIISPSYTSLENKTSQRRYMFILDT